MNGSVLTLDFAETADREEFRRAVLAGLSGTPRAIPAKFLYDARGSALFDEICELPEYYLTRTETEILQQRAAEIGRRAGPGCALVEFGSGSSVKSRLLIEALPELALYAPIDISREHLDATAARLRRDYPGAAGRAGVRRLHGLGAADRVTRRGGWDSSRARPSATSSPRRPRPSCGTRATAAGRRRRAGARRRSQEGSAAPARRLQRLRRV